MGYVYKITNTVNGKAYIGISIYEPEKQRIKQHLAGRGNRLIASAVKKYGKESLAYEILEDNIFPELLSDLEISYIKRYNTLVPNGYNLSLGGEHGKHSEVSRQKMSDIQKSNPSRGMLGKKHSVETRKRMSETQSGEKNPRFGKPSPRRGKKHTEASKQKMSKSRKGKTSSNKGKVFSPQARRNMSKAHLGQTPTDETRRKLSEAAKKRTKQKRIDQVSSDPVKMRSNVRRRERLANDSEYREHINAQRKQRRRERLANDPEYREYVNMKARDRYRKKNNSQPRRDIKISAQEFFFSLSHSLTIQEKRRIMHKTFSGDRDPSTINYWIREWQSET